MISYKKNKINNNCVFPVEAKDIKKVFSTNINKKFNRLAVFASFNNNAIIDDRVIYYLKSLLHVVDGIIFIADNPILEEEIAKIKDFVIYAKFQHHGCYDFGSYKKGILWAAEAGLLEDIDELVLCNDSCYGPIYPLTEAFTKMKQSKCDFWGMLDSYEGRHHILSFFYVFRRSVLHSPVFFSYISNFKKLGGFWDYVNKYERMFTYILEQEGFKSDVYIKIDIKSKERLIKIIGHQNITAIPDMLFEYRMPLLKVKAMNNGFGLGLYSSPYKILTKLKQENPELGAIVAADIKNKGIVFEDRWMTADYIVKNFDVISFDIFDTLLLRPYKKPTDLFYHMEKELKKPGFCKARVEAERKARIKFKNQDEITLDQIYECIECTDFNQLKEKELNFEFDVLYKNQQIYEIYKEAIKYGKIVLAVSDMYLPKEFLVKVLIKNGYTELTDIFVSSELNGCKYNKKIFKYILKKLNLLPQQIIHIGDNITSDKEIPESLGIRGCYKPSLVKELTDLPANTKFANYALESSLTSSVFLALFANFKKYNNLESPLFELGYLLGGPLAVGFCQFIEEKCQKNNIDHIIFTARDGYSLHKVYNILFDKPRSSSYIYATRSIILQCLPFYSQNIIYKRKILCMYLQDDCESLSDKDVLTKFEELKHDLELWSRKNLDNYKQYISSQNILGNRIAAVDMTTGSFSSLHFFNAIFGKKCKFGLFTYCFNSEKNLKYYSWGERLYGYKDDPIINLSEELITSPECSIIGIADRKPIFQTWNVVETYRANNYKEILRGIVAFTQDYKRILNKHRIEIPCAEIEKLMKHYIICMNNSDINLFKHMYHSYGSSSLNYLNLYDDLIKYRNFSLANRNIVFLIKRFLVELRTHGTKAALRKTSKFIIKNAVKYIRR